MDRMRGSFWWVDWWRTSPAYTSLPLAAQGAYRNLWDELWLRGGVIPNDDRTMANASGDPVEWPKLKDLVLPHMRLTEHGWTIPEQEAAQRKSMELKEKRALAGLEGAKRRWEKDGNDDGKTDGKADAKTMPTEHRTPNTEQGTSTDLKPSASLVSPPASDPSGLFGPDGPDGETRPEPQKSKAEPNGAKILADLWAELCPHLDQPRRPLAPGIARSLVASWKRDPDADLWRERFAFVAESDTYSGRKPGFSWKADISWATGPKNSAKLDAKANRNHEAPVENFSDYNRRSAEQAKRIRLPWETEDVAPWDGEAIANQSESQPIRLVSHDQSEESAVAAKVNGLVRGFLNGKHV